MTEGRWQRWQRPIQIGAPLVAVATMMLGLRVGAKSAVRAAVVFGAPPARVAPGPGAKTRLTRLAWQMLTFLDDRGVRETIPMRDLTVVARSKGHEARWSGASNEDGVAEVSLEIEGLVAGDPLSLEVRAAGDPEPLAQGEVVWGDDAAESLKRDVAWGAKEEGKGLRGAVRPTSRTGDVGLDVVIEGERLVTGFPSTLWVHAAPPPGISHGGIAIEASPEPGLAMDREKATTCENGWAEFSATAVALVTGSGFRASGGGGSTGTGGSWFGSLPIAAGAFFVSVPRVLPANTATTAVLIAPNPRTVVYAELDDEKGRVVAGALRVTLEPGDPTPRARFELPPLAPGLHWLVVSGEPRGAEHLLGSAIAKPILVGDAPGVDVHHACSVGPWLAQRHARGFSRWIALDGLPARSRANRFRHAAGLAIAAIALLSAGVLEAILLVGAARRARMAMQLAELDDDAQTDATAAKLTARPPGGGLAIALLLVLLGFALLASLLVAKA